MGTVKVSVQGGIVQGDSAQGDSVQGDSAQGAPSEDESSREAAGLDGRVKISVGSENERFSLTGGFRRHGAEVSAVFAWGGRSDETDT